MKSKLTPKTIFIQELENTDYVKNYIDQVNIINLYKVPIIRPMSSSNKRDEKFQIVNRFREILLLKYKNDEQNIMNEVVEKK